MYDVSADYVSKINSCLFGAIDEKISGQINLADGATFILDDSAIKAGSLRVSGSLFDGNCFSLGSARPLQLDVEILNFDANLASLEGATVLLQYQLNKSAEQSPWYELVPFPAFRIAADTIKRNDTAVRFSAFDAILDFDEYIDDIYGDETPALLIGTPFELLTAACGKCGVPLKNTQAEIENMPNGDITLAQAENVQTWRDLIGWTAAALGGVCKISRDNKLEIRVLKNNSAVRSIPEKTRKNTAFSDAKKQIRNIVFVHNGEKKGFNITLQQAKYTLELPQNPLTNELDDGQFAAFANNIMDSVTSLSYYDCSFVFFGDPAFDVGDTIAVPVLFNDGITREIPTIITNFEWNYKGWEVISGKNSLSEKTTPQPQTSKDVSARQKVLFYSAADLFPPAGATNTLYIVKQDLTQWIWDTETQAYVRFSSGGGIPPPFLDRPSGEYPLGFRTQIHPPNDPDHPEYADMEIFYLQDSAPLQKYTPHTYITVDEDSAFRTFGILHIGETKKLSAMGEYIYVIFQPHFSYLFNVIPATNLFDDAFISALYSHFNSACSDVLHVNNTDVFASDNALIQLI